MAKKYPLKSWVNGCFIRTKEKCFVGKVSLIFHLKKTKMKHYIAIFFFFVNIVFLSSCKTGSCACPMTYEKTDEGLEKIEVSIKNTDVKVEKIAAE